MAFRLTFTQKRQTLQRDAASPATWSCYACKVGKDDRSRCHGGLRETGDIPYGSTCAGTSQSRHAGTCIPIVQLEMRRREGTAGLVLHKLECQTIELRSSQLHDMPSAILLRDIFSSVLSSAVVRAAWQ